MEQIIVRYAVPSDAEALHALNEAFNGPGVADAAQVRQTLRAPGGEIVCLALDGEAAVGFCCAQVMRSVCYQDVTGELTELYVAPDYRRKGIAARLIARAEAAMAARGVVSIRLLTGADNVAAKACYRALGYVDTDEVLFEKHLS